MSQLNVIQIVFFLVEYFSFKHMDRSTVEEYVEIIEFDDENNDCAVCWNLRACHITISLYGVKRKIVFLPQKD